MFRSTHMAIFRLLREEGFFTLQYNYVYYVPYEISYYVHHGCMVVKYKFYNLVHRWGYVRY
jgi:hypothetical protein